MAITFTGVAGVKGSRYEHMWAHGTPLCGKSVWGMPEDAERKKPLCVKCERIWERLMAARDGRETE